MCDSYDKLVEKIKKYNSNCDLELLKKSYICTIIIKEKHISKA